MKPTTPPGPSQRWPERTRRRFVVSELAARNAEEGASLHGVPVGQYVEQVMLDVVPELVKLMVTRQMMIGIEASNTEEVDTGTGDVK